MESVCVRGEFVLYARRASRTATQVVLAANGIRKPNLVLSDCYLGQAEAVWVNHLRSA